MSTAATLAVAAIGALLGKWLKIPAGPLLLTAFAGSVLHLNGIVSLHLPHWMLAVAYGLIGVYVGLQFNREILQFAVSNLLAMIIAILVMLAICGGVAAALSHMMDIDLLTAYLATTPGAIDSIAIVALGSDVDMSTVISVQTIRFLSIVILAPYLVRIIGKLPQVRPG